MKAAIHQPNFFPWLGLFHRLSLVDTYIAFDHVQAMRGKSWLSRNRILLHGEPRWLTIPTCKSGRQFQRVTDVEINYQANFVNKHIGTLRQAYARTPHFDTVFSLVREIYELRIRSLAEFNMRFIQAIAERLRLNVRILYSSEVVAAHPDLATLSGNEIVLALCQRAGVTHYISGNGCLDFIRPVAFDQAGIKFEFQQFLHPRYLQYGEPDFISHLSTLDALFRVGFDGVQAMLSQPVIDARAA